jgi:hypothetical protein
MGGGNIRGTISIEEKLIDNFSKAQNKVTNSLDNFINTANTAVAPTKRTEKAMSRITTNNKKVKQSQMGVTMSLLGTMFAGMALQRAMNGLLKTTIEWLGISELWNTTMGVLFLPIMTQLLDALIPLMEWFMDLPEGVQMAIGGIVLFLYAAGGLLALFGQIGLGLQGITMLFPRLATAITGAGGLFQWLGGLITGISATFLIVAAIIIAVVVGMYLAWKENFLGMKSFVDNFLGGIKQAFGGIITFFKGVWEVLKGLFTGNGDLIVEGFKKMFKGLFDFLVGTLKVALNLVVMVVIGVVRLVVGLVQGVINGIIAAYDKISKFFGGKGTEFRVDWVNQLSNAVPKFANGGIVPGPIGKPQLAVVHGGEEVTPTKDVGKSEQLIYSPNINISANVSSDYDVRRLATQLNKYWAEDFQKMQRARI